MGRAALLPTGACSGVRVGALGELVWRWGCPQSTAAEPVELCGEEEDAQHHRGIKTAAPEHCPGRQGKVCPCFTAVRGTAGFGLQMLYPKASTKQKVCWEQICPDSSKGGLRFTGIYP